MQESPAILGVFRQDRIQKAGRTVAATREFTQSLLWLVLALDAERCLALPLGENNLPGKVRTPLARRDLAASYVPEPALFRDRLLPVLLSLRERLAQGGAAMAEMSMGEAQVLGALSLDLPGPWADSQGAARVLLDSLPADMDDFPFETAAAINDEGVALRRARKPERAVAYLSQALTITPRDDHLIFNLARAHFDNRDVENCRGCLAKALSMNPGLSVAQRFLDYLSRRAKRSAPIRF
jgi:tetratricopeptide (TPR) repeat protein